MSRLARVAPHIVIDQRYVPGSLSKTCLLSVASVALLILGWLLVAGRV